MFGDDWEKEMMKVEKKVIIGMFRNLALSYQQCTDDLDKVVCEFCKKIDEIKEGK